METLYRKFGNNFYFFEGEFIENDKIQPNTVHSFAREWIVSKTGPIKLSIELDRTILRPCRLNIYPNESSAGYYLQIYSTKFKSLIYIIRQNGNKEYPITTHMDNNFNCSTTLLEYKKLLEENRDNFADNLKIVIERFIEITNGESREEFIKPIAIGK